MLNLRAIVFLLLAAAIVLLLSGCEPAQRLEASPPPTTTVGSEPSPVEYVSPTPVPTYPNFRATVETEVQLTRVARATAHALTPTLPPPTRASITNTPEPLRLGILPFSPEIRIYDCDYNSGWRGILNSEYVDVWAGGAGIVPRLVRS